MSKLTKKEFNKIKPCLTTSQRFILAEEDAMEWLGSLLITAPNTMNTMCFSIDGFFEVCDCYGKVIKKYKTFEKAIDYLLLND